MSFLGRFWKGKVDYTLALDIGTEVAKALIFRAYPSEEKVVVEGVGKVEQKIGNMQSGTVFNINGVVETCREAIDQALEQAGIKKVNKAIIGIAGELVKGTTTTVHYERSKPEVKIELNELRNIIEKVQLKALERIRRQMTWETGRNDIEIKLVNAAIVDVRIDGYQVSSPLNFQGRDVSISIFNAYAPLIHLGALATIAENLSITYSSIVAEPYAVARSVDYDDVLDFSAIFLDIGGGTTDIAVVRNGGLEGTKMFALGGRAFTKRLSREFNISLNEAEALKIKYSEGKLGADVNLKIEQVLRNDYFVWASGVELALAEFAESDVLPSKILLCGGGSALPGIRKVLGSAEWIKNLPFTRNISVNFLQPRDVSRVVDKTGQLLTPQDVTPMGLANLSLDIAGEDKVMAGILKRIVQKIQKR